MIPELEKNYFLMTQESWDKKPNISNSDIGIGCPVCEEGNSKGKKQRCHLYEYKDKLLVHCFNCGLHNHFRNYLKNYFPTLYKQYLSEMIHNTSDLSSLVLEQKVDELKEENFKAIPIEKFSDLGFNPATDSKKAMAYLYGRGVDTKYFKNFYYGNYKNFGDGIVIPFFINFKTRKEIYGYQYRHFDKKVFNIYLPEENKGYKIYNYFTNEKTLYIFESVFDLYSNDIPLENKICSFGSDLDVEKFKDKELIFCFDNDETGYKKALKYSQKGFKVFIWSDDIRFKDFNEILQFSIRQGKNVKEIRKKISNMIQSNIYYGLSAEIKLKLKV